MLTNCLTFYLYPIIFLDQSFLYIFTNEVSTAVSHSINSGSSFIVFAWSLVLRCETFICCSQLIQTFSYIKSHSNMCITANLQRPISVKLHGRIVDQHISIHSSPIFFVCVCCVMLLIIAIALQTLCCVFLVTYVYSHCC